MSVIQSIELVSYCYFNMPNLNKTYLIWSLYCHFFSYKKSWRKNFRNFPLPNSCSYSIHS